MNTRAVYMGFIWLLALLLSDATLAQSDGAMVSISGRDLYVQTDRIASPTAPHVVLLNGLTNTTASFNRVTRALNVRGYHVTRFDFYGQGRSLPEDITQLPRSISYGQQTADLKALITKLQADGVLPQKVHLAGQSYGAGIGLYLTKRHQEWTRNHISSLSAFAPFTEPLEEMDRKIKQEIQILRSLFPLADWNQELLYDQIYRRRVFENYWLFEPEVISVDPIVTYRRLEGVSALGNGIRHLVLTGQHMPRAAVPAHIIYTLNDQYIPSEVIDRYVENRPLGERGAVLQIQGVEHKVLQDAPRMSADLIDSAAKDALSKDFFRVFRAPRPLNTWTSFPPIQASPKKVSCRSIL